MPSGGDVRSGSIATELGCLRHFRFTPVSDLTAHVTACLKPADSEKRAAYSISSSASDNRWDGICRPSAFAVLRLMTSFMERRSP